MPQILTQLFSCDDGAEQEKNEGNVVENLHFSEKNEGDVVENLHFSEREIGDVVSELTW
jgi:hypothetical protein